VAEADRIRWDARYRQKGLTSEAPSTSLTTLANWLPTRGRALDLAGGTGRHALWLAGRGLDVTLADISDVALEQATEEASRRGVRLRTMRVDVDTEGLPQGPWDLILCTYFLWRPLFEVAPDGLATGGRLVVIHPTRSNLLRHERPGPEYLLEDGELPGLVRGLEIVGDDEGWTADGRHEARLVARKNVQLHSSLPAAGDAV
jgi:tellurite methyltransferase